VKANERDPSEEVTIAIVGVLGALPVSQAENASSILVARLRVMSAANGVVDGRADSAHDLFINSTEWPRERALENSVKAVAVDDRALVDACVVVVEIDLRCKSPYHCGDLGDGCESPHVNYF
jgi:hypothetical protein